TRRNRLEHLLLLALRCLVLVLLAVGFARPFLRKPMASNEPQAGSRRIALLLDTSASMRRAGLWPAGVAKANSTVASARPGDQVAVYTFDRQLHPLITFDQWNQTPVSERVAIVSQKLAQTSPGWSGTWLGEALIAAAETLADTVAKGGT